jgi:hypothetical protein
MGFIWFWMDLGYILVNTGDRLSGFLKCREFPNQRSKYGLLKENSVPWNWLRSRLRLHTILSV